MGRHHLLLSSAVRADRLSEQHAVAVADLALGVRSGRWFGHQPEQPHLCVSEIGGFITVRRLAANSPLWNLFLLNGSCLEVGENLKVADILIGKRSQTSFFNHLFPTEQPKQLRPKCDVFFPFDFELIYQLHTLSGICLEDETVLLQDSSAHK